VSYLPGEEWPDNDDPEMPKAGRYPDWIAAVMQYDGPLAEQFCNIFPGKPNPFTSQEIARKYWKRRKGPLHDQFVRCLIAYHNDANRPGPDLTWQARDYNHLLDTKYLAMIFPLLVEARRDKRQEIIADIQCGMATEADLRKLP